MITRIEFENFKCLDKRYFTLNKLNILSGYNGRGKSSVLQSLLLLSQSAPGSVTDLAKLHLKGHFADLGKFKELLTDESNSTLKFIIDSSDTKFRHAEFGYRGNEKDSLVGDLTECVIDDVDYFGTIGDYGESTVADSATAVTDDFNQLSKSIPDYVTSIFRNVNYVSADRQGPQKYEELEEFPENHRVDHWGKNVVNTINSYSKPVPAERRLRPSDGETTLQTAVSEWVDYIMNGGEINVHHDDESQVISLDICTNSDKGSRRFKPYNVGFGYSYILAIIVTSLIGQKDSIVIIENPEAHLHGQAQSRLTELLSKLAASGVQVFIETHSEHIVNGFRKEMLKDNCSLTNEDTSIYFFDKDFEPKKLKIESNGYIPNWPAGFFDQEKYDLAEIFALGARLRAKRDEG